MFGHAAWGNITLPAEVFPTRAIGTVTGLGGAFGGLAGVLTQLAIGRTVQAESFTPIFVICALIYLAALSAVQLLVGELGAIVASARCSAVTDAPRVVAMPTAAMRSCPLGTAPQAGTGVSASETDGQVAR